MIVIPESGSIRAVGIEACMPGAWRGPAFRIAIAFGRNASAVYVPEAKLSGANVQEQGIASYTTRMSQLQVDLGAAYRF